MPRGSLQQTDFTQDVPTRNPPTAWVGADRSHRGLACLDRRNRQTGVAQMTTVNRSLICSSPQFITEELQLCDGVSIADRFIPDQF